MGESYVGNVGQKGVKHVILISACFSNRRKMIAHLIDCNPEQIEELSEEEEDSEDDYSDSDSDDEPR